MARVNRIMPADSIRYMAPEVTFADVIFEAGGQRFIRGINRHDLVDHA